MELKVVENILLGAAGSAGESGDRISSGFVKGRIVAEITRAVMKPAQVNGGQQMVPFPTVIYRSAAVVPDTEQEDGKGNETWIDTSVINLADAPVTGYFQNEEAVKRSPWSIVQGITRIAQQLAQGATVIVAENNATHTRYVQALMDYKGVRFVASFQLDANRVENVEDYWAIAVLKKPGLQEIVEVAINQGFKGTMPPKEWDFLKDVLTSVVYAGERVWGMRAEYSAAYLAMVNHLDTTYARQWEPRTTINKEFGEG